MAEAHPRPNFARAIRLLALDDETNDAEPRFRRAFQDPARDEGLYDCVLSASALRASIADFIDVIRTHRQPLCIVANAAKTVAVCLAGVEAYRIGETVSLEKYRLPEFGEFVS